MNNINKFLLIGAVILALIAVVGLLITSALWLGFIFGGLSWIFIGIEAVVTKQQKREKEETISQALKTERGREILAEKIVEAQGKELKEI